MIKINGKRKNSYVYYKQGDPYYLHRVKRTRGDTCYLGCCDMRCGAIATCHSFQRDSAVLDRVGENFLLTKPHNHFNPTNLADINLLRAECTRRAELERTAPRQIFDEVRESYPLGTGSFSKLEGSMHRARRAAQPNLPTSVEEVHSLLATDERYSTTVQGSPFYRTTLRLGADGLIIISVSPTIAAAIQTEQELHVDATFKCVPRLFHQLFTVHVTVFDHIFPMAYVLMEKRTTPCYVEIFRYLMENFDLRASVIFCDYEMALQRAAQEMFPNARLTGCLFHYDQAVWRQVQHRGLTDAFHRTTEDGQTSHEAICIRLALALPFLPAARIEEGVREVEAAADQSEDPATINFAAYVRVQWIGRVGPSIVSVHGQPRRTNNAVESFNRELSRRFSIHPNTWHFLDLSPGGDQFDQLMEMPPLRQRVDQVLVTYDGSASDSEGFDELPNLTGPSVTIGGTRPVSPTPAQPVQVEHSEPGTSQAEADEVVVATSAPQVDTTPINCCRICLIGRLEIGFIPCGHLASCESCARQIHDRCPMCRTAFDSKHRMYF